MSLKIAILCNIQDGQCYTMCLISQNTLNSVFLFNGANVSGYNISNGDSKINGSGVVPLYLQKGDVVKIAYFSTFRMSVIELRVRY